MTDLYLPAGHPWEFRLHRFETIDSTNTYAKKLAQQGAPEGTAVISLSQTQGRGRLGRQFHSPSGMGVYLSVILRPDCYPRELMHLTCAVASAACQAIEQAVGFCPDIKWTNDIIWGKRKLGGILTEISCDRSGKLDYVIVGIGINCCQTQDAFPEDLQAMAASLSMVTGTPVDPAAVGNALLLSLHRLSKQILTGKAAYMDFYRRHCATLGKEVRVVCGDTVRLGTALTLDDSGALLVRFSDGQEAFVSAGEVSIRGMYGYL